MAAQDPAPDCGDEKAGLCRLCLHVRLVKTGRGSTFSLCRRSETDPRFARYPRLPVVRCPGFEPDPEKCDG
jgi:hypothetical protein